MKRFKVRLAGKAYCWGLFRHPILRLGMFVVACLLALGCRQEASKVPSKDIADDAGRKDLDARAIVVDRDVRMKEYFPYMDSLVQRYDSLVAYALTEHLLVRANAWIVDSLASYDYDARMLKGEFIEDQKEIVVLHRLDTLWLPDDSTAAFLLEQMGAMMIDVNIPEYTLRIVEHGAVKYTFSVRVGRNEEKYLAVAGRMMSLPTPIGEGEVVRLERNPIFVNPVDGKQYYETHRDDGMLTKMPQIPFIEPIINGVRSGALIHPTTNPHTLGKAYSNGCVGMRESDAWIVYYHAPIGTKVRYRYDLHVLDDCGDTLWLEDIYHLDA